MTKQEKILQILDIKKQAAKVEWKASENSQDEVTNRMAYFTILDIMDDIKDVIEDDFFTN